MTPQPAPAPSGTLSFVRSKVVWLAVAAAAAAAWAYRKVAGPPVPLTRGEKKQRRKAVVRAAALESRRKY